MTSSLTIGGAAVPVKLRRSTRAQRISLRVDPQDRAVVLVLPGHVPPAQGMAFARSQTDWLAARLAALPAAIPFVDGMVLSLLGTDHPVHHCPEDRGGVWIEGGRILVSGRPEHFSRRLSDWLKRQARAEITTRALPMAATINRTAGRISLRDPRSRWGSCTSRGDLAFSWRLILAPASVMDYVVAHEVAHLAEMNHSPVFWRTVRRLVADIEGPRRWLRQNGSELHRYG